MDLQANNLGQSQSLVKQQLYVVQMREKTVGILVALTAMNFSSVEAEAIAETFGLSARLGHELLAEQLKCIEIVPRHGEVRMKADALVSSRHWTIVH